jgi:hypothetical protein
MDSDVLRKMLSWLKTKRGCTLDDLSAALPERYRYMDYDPEYLALETVSTLVKWGLAEAYDKGNLLTPADMAAFNRHKWSSEVEFYISKAAVDIEDAFGVRLDAAPSQIFGEPQAQFGRWPDVFVLMPFNTDLRPVYEDHIKKVVSAKQLRVGRADDFFAAGSVMGDVWSAINAATFLIADCTGRNPNVFYEIGIAHAIGKQTVLISQNIDDVPFDLRHLRVVVYDYTPRGMSSFEDVLGKTIDSLQAQGGNSAA